MARTRPGREITRRLSEPERSRERRRHPLATSLQRSEATLLDVVDNLLNKGVLVNAEVILALANVDLVYLRLSVLLAAADRILGPSSQGR